MAETAIGRRRLQFERLIRWAGGVTLAASIVFIGERLWRLDWASLAPHASWELAIAMTGAPLLFAAADRTLARGWAMTADPEGRCTSAELTQIYARGVLMKYLPGSVFQYLSRQVGGARAGLPHKRVAQASMIEIGLHLVASLSVAAACFVAAHSPLLAVAGIAAPVAVCLFMRRRLLLALAFQILAFALFAAAAALIGWAILPAGSGLAVFAALFLLAWLAGFVVPVAPGGIGVREAALLALGGGLPAAGLMAATLALRAASIAGDLLYGLTTLAAQRR